MGGFFINIVLPQVLPVFTSFVLSFWSLARTSFFYPVYHQTPSLKWLRIVLFGHLEDRSLVPTLGFTPKKYASIGFGL
jgi:hypothetical protein